MDISNAEAGLIVPLLVLGFIGVYFVVMLAVSRWVDRRKAARRARAEGDASDGSRTPG